MATMDCLGGAFWLGLIASGLWKLALGVKALVTQQAVLRNFRFRVTRLGPGRIEVPPTLLAGDLAVWYGLLQMVCGLLIAGPLGLVPVLGGGFPWSIFICAAAGWIGAALGVMFIRQRAGRFG